MLDDDEEAEESKAKPRGSGHPLTEEKINRILERVRLGVYPSTAAAAVGVTSQAISMRKKRDPEFAALLAQAEAQAEESMTLAVVAHFKKHPKIVIETMARRFPEKWARPEIRAQLNTSNVDTKTLAQLLLEGIAGIAQLHAPFGDPDVDAEPGDDGKSAP